MTDSAPSAFVPTAPTAVSAAPDGSWIAVAEPGQITIVDPVTAAVRRAIQTTSRDVDVAWAGNPSRLVVVERGTGSTSIRLIDLGTGRAVGEARVDEPVRVLATGALHALLVGERGTRVVTATGDRLDVGEFPSKAVPTAAGAFGPHHVVVAVNGALEEWDTHARQPRRRFRLPKPTAIRFVGGTERVLWTVSDAEPNRVDIFPLVQRGQPRQHDLPEPIAAIAGHSRVELLVWIGAATGQARLIDLDGKGRGRDLGEPGQKACALVAGTQISAVLAAPDAFLAIEVLDSRGLEPRRTTGITSVTDPGSGEVILPAPAAPRAPTTSRDERKQLGPVDPAADAALETADTPDATWPDLGDLDTPLDGVAAASPGTGTGRSAAAGSGGVRRDPIALGSGDDDEASARADALAAAAARTARTAATSARVERAAAVAAGQVDRAVTAADRIAAIGASLSNAPPASSRELAQRLAGARDAVDAVPPRASAVADEARRGPPSLSSIRHTPASTPRAISRAWRETLIDWTRTALAGTPPPPPTSSPIDPLVGRLGLPAELAPGIALLYGAHLLGHDGIAAADLARALKGWDEALGNGALASSGVAQWRRSRIRLAPVIRDALDERPPRTGTITGEPGAASTLITPCAVRVSSGHAADAATALVERAGGSYLVPTAGADAAELLLEARARGAIALLPADAPVVAGTARVIGPDADAGDLAVFDAG